MKKAIHIFTSVFVALLFLVQDSMAQDLAPDQNPNYMASRDKYMKMADSINAWHSTTPQQTYKAIDYLADKREAREERRAFRRALRMERAQRGGYYYSGYDDYYGNDYYNRYPYYNSYRYRRNWNAHFNYALPLALTLGGWWCR